MGISKFEYEQMLARTGRVSGRESNLMAGYDPAERETGADGLHSQIEAECRHRLWPYIHSRTDRKSTTGVGTVDFVIAAEGGRTFYIECKAKSSGKETVEQRGFAMMLERNGHVRHLVTSLEQFLEIVKEKGPGENIPAQNPVTNTHNSTQASHRLPSKH